MNTPLECTLLELVQALNQVTDDDQEVVAAAVSLINSGRVRLRGNFAGMKIALPHSLAPFRKSLWPALVGLTVNLSH